MVRSSCVKDCKSECYGGCNISFHRYVGDSWKVAMIQVTIRPLDEREDRIFTVEDETTVGQLREIIREEMNIPLDLIRLIFCGKRLHDNVKLSEYGVDDKVVHLVPYPPPISLSGLQTSQTQQTQPRDNANPPTEREPYRPPSSPVPRITFDPPSDAVLEQQHQAKLTPHAGRVDFIDTIIDETENTIDYVEYYQALAASTNIPVVLAEDGPEAVSPMDVDNQELSANDDRMNVDQPRPSTSSSQDGHFEYYGDGDSFAPCDPQPSTSDQSQDCPTSPEVDPNPIPPVPHRRPPRPPKRPLLTTPTDLAEVFEKLRQLEKRFEPYKAVYCDLLRDRTTAMDLPSLEVTRRQAIMEMIGDVMHAIGHVYHALSDIDLSIGDYTNRLTTDPVQTDTSTPQQVPPAPATPLTVLRRNPMPSFTPASTSTQHSARPHASNEFPQPGTSDEASTSHQVQDNVPARRVDTMLMQEMMANMQNPFQLPSNQQSGQAEQSQQNRGANSGHTGNTQGQTGTAQGQTGTAQGQTGQAQERPRVFMEIENLVRTLTQGHPNIDVVMSMEELQPVGSPINFGPVNIGGMDIFPSDPGNEEFLFDLHSAAMQAMQSASSSHTGSPAGGNDNGATNAGIRFITPGGPNSRFNMPGFAAAYVDPESEGSPPGISISAVGPTTLQFQPDGGVFVTPVGSGPQSDAFTAMINNVFRTNTTANVSSTSTTSGTNTTANTSNATANTTNSTSTSASPIPNPVFTIDPNVAANVSTPFTVHSHVTYRLPAEAALGHTINMEAIPVAVRSGSSGVTRRTTNERRRNNRELNLLFRSQRFQTLNHLSNARAHQQAQDAMLYDRYLNCNNVYANERLRERRTAYQERNSEQLTQRSQRTNPTCIEHLECVNYNLTTRHMACMMRLLSGPITRASRLSALMVTVARRLYLDPEGRGGSLHPPVTPQEFYFVRMHMRDYLQKILTMIENAGARYNLFDQVAAVILGHSRPFLEQMDQFTMMTTPAPPMEMLRTWLRMRIPALLACIVSDATSDAFAETFYITIERFYTELCAFVMSFCDNGFEGFRELYMEYIVYLTDNFEVTSREWVRLLARENMLAVQSAIDPMTPASYSYQRTRVLRRPSPHGTPPPPPARNDTPDTAESLPSMSNQTMSLGSLDTTGSPSPPQADDFEGGPMYMPVEPSVTSPIEPESPPPPEPSTSAAPEQSTLPPPEQTLPETAATRFVTAIETVVPTQPIK